MKRYRVLEHTADLGIELEASRLDEAIGVAACAMFELMGEPQAVLGAATVEVTADGVDREDLLVGLLTELLAALELEGAYLDAVDEVIVAPPVEKHGEQALWRATLRGRARRVDRQSDDLGLIEIKAVTYHDLVLEPFEIVDGSVHWRVRVIFDL